MVATGAESEEKGGNMSAAQQQRQRYLQERVRVLEEEEVEFIDVPQFAEGNPAKIVHDFKKVRERGIWQTLLFKATYKKYLCRKGDGNISLHYHKHS